MATPNSKFQFLSFYLSRFLHSHHKESRIKSGEKPFRRPPRQTPIIKMTNKNHKISQQPSEADYLDKTIKKIDDYIILRDQKRGSEERDLTTKTTSHKVIQMNF